MSVASRLRTLERRAGLDARARALCRLCRGLGKLNARSIGPDDHDDRPLEPCPGCGKVRLMTIHVPVCERISGEPMVTIRSEPHDHALWPVAAP